MNGQAANLKCGLSINYEFQEVTLPVDPVYNLTEVIVELESEN